MPIIQLQTNFTNVVLNKLDTRQACGWVHRQTESH